MCGGAFGASEFSSLLSQNRPGHSEYTRTYRDPQFGVVNEPTSFRGDQTTQTGVSGTGLIVTVCYLVCRDSWNQQGNQLLKVDKVILCSATDMFLFEVVHLLIDRPTRLAHPVLGKSCVFVSSPLGRGISPACNPACHPSRNRSRPRERIRAPGAVIKVTRAFCGCHYVTVHGDAATC